MTPLVERLRELVADDERQSKLGCGPHIVIRHPDARAVLALLDAAKRGVEFIHNGCEFGYIRMPDTPDKAHDTEPALVAAIRALESPT